MPPDKKQGCPKKKQAEKSDQFELISWLVIK